MSGNAAESAEADLTPMLDMVFQLITFFMLVINFKSASLDLDLKLPVVGSARPVDTKGQEDLLILNINKAGELKIYNIAQEIESYIAGEAQVTRMKAKGRGENIEVGGELPSTVVVRADKGVPFKLLNRVIAACQQNGFRKFALKAKDKSE